jgi:zinc D-Ala-D-Ala carboxypeptidase
MTTDQPHAHPRRPARARHRGALLAGALVAGVLLLLLGHRALDPARAEDAAPGPVVPTTATGLDAELERRFVAAQQAAAADGVTLTLTSGWRTAERQQELVDEAVARYGDAEEAHRWVLPPEESAHVRGLAVDVGPTEGALWLGEHGLEHGLCRTYANESWHFEMLPDGAQECPAMLADSSWAW